MQKYIILDDLVHPLLSVLTEDPQVTHRCWLYLWLFTYLFMVFYLGYNYQDLPLFEDKVLCSLGWH